MEPIRLAIVTISDAASRGEREDTSGDAIETWAGKRGHVVVGRSVVPDEHDRIVERLKAVTDGDAVDLVRDLAFPATDVLDHEVRGSVAVTEAGRRLNDRDLEYVEVSVGSTPCPACGEPFDSGYIAADTALVGLVLELEVFNADSVEHAQRIAKSEVGGALRDVPLKVIETFETEADEEDAVA